MNLSSNKRIVVIFVLFGAVLPCCGQNPARSTTSKNLISAGLNVEDVIKMSKAGLSDDIIIQQLKKKPRAFDLPRIN